MVYLDRVIFTISISIILCACALTQNQTTQTANKSSHTLEPIIQLGHSDEVTKALFIPNTGYVATASLDGTVKLWESESGREIRTLKSSKTKKLVRYENQREIQGLNLTNKCYALAVSPNGNILVSGDIFGRIHIWDITTGKLSNTVKSFWRNHLINSIVFFNDGKKFVAGSADGRLHVWDFNSRWITNRLNPHSLKVNALAMGPNDRYILSGSSDGTLIRWDIMCYKKAKSTYW